MMARDSSEMLQMHCAHKLHVALSYEQLLLSENSLFKIRWNVLKYIQ